LKYFFYILSFSLLLLTTCDDSTSSGDEPAIEPPLFEVAFPCENGLAAGQYPCSNVDLVAHLTPPELLANQPAGSVFLNDIWGWTDPETGTNYALVGTTNGVTFVDLSDPANPVVAGKLEESSIAGKIKLPQKTLEACTFGVGSGLNAASLQQNSVWRDFKVFDDHLYVVSDGQAHGMQVFDLTRLREFDGETPLTLTEDNLYDRFLNAHNIAINEETGFAYVIGITNSEICGSRDSTGLHMIDLNNPKNPEFAGCYFDPETDLASSPNVGNGYIHDTQCVNYAGPDSDHAGKEICVSSAEGAVVITDVTDKSLPVTLGFDSKVDMRYSHQGWLTEDHSFFLMNDEVDEMDFGRNTKTYVWDVRDLDNPEFVGFHEHNGFAIDHNLYIKNELVFQSNYTSGLRILKINDAGTADFTEAAFFDTFPQSNSANFDGTWSNYPFFDNGLVLVSDITNGLFILKPNIN